MMSATRTKKTKRRLVQWGQALLALAMTFTAGPVPSSWAEIDTVAPSNQTKQPFSGSHFPEGVAVSPGGTKVYLANRGDGTVSVFAALIGAVANTTSVGTVSVGSDPEGVAVSPDGGKVYVANFSDGTVSVIDTSTNPPTVSATISVGSNPEGVAVSPDGSKVFIANSGSNSVSVIQQNTVVATINVGQHPTGVVVSPDGTKVYVANANSSTVSVIEVVGGQCRISPCE